MRRSSKSTPKEASSLYAGIITETGNTSDEAGIELFIFLVDLRVVKGLPYKSLTPLGYGKAQIGMLIKVKKRFCEGGYIFSGYQPGCLTVP
jgi:hypothetical protein